MIDEIPEHRPLHAAGILHPHHGEGEHVLEHARRRESVGGSDLAAIIRDGVRALGAVHAKSCENRLGIGEDVVAHPGQRQVGDDLVLVVEIVEIAADLRCGDDVVIAEHHALGTPSGARRVEDDGEILALARRERLSEPGLGFRIPPRASCARHQ